MNACGVEIGAVECFLLNVISLMAQNLTDLRCRRMKHRYYQPSGKIPLGGVALVGLMALVAAVVVGALYGVVVYYNPFYYFNMIAAVLASILAIGVVNVVSVDGKIRNVACMKAIGIIMGIVTYLVSWIAYASLYKGTLIHSPAVCIATIQEIGLKGVWAEKGIILYIAWIAEALLFVFIGYSFLATGKGLRPFCENCDQMTEPYHEGAIIIKKQNKTKLRTALENKQYKIFNQILKQEPKYSNCFLMIFSVCPECKDSNFLSIYHFTLKRDEEGERVEEQKLVIDNLIVPFSFVERLTEKATTLNRIRVDEEEDDNLENLLKPLTHQQS